MTLIATGAARFLNVALFEQVRTVDQGRGAASELPPGSTPLHAAAFRGDVGIVQAVLQVHAWLYNLPLF